MRYVSNMHGRMFVALAALVTSTFGQPAVQAGAASEALVYGGNGMVLQEGVEAPQLCLGTIYASLPPQCYGIPMNGWDWDAVTTEKRRSDSIWGDYHVTGTYDGSSFTVVTAGPPEPGEGGGGGDHQALCPRPDGGWKWPDPDRVRDRDFYRAVDYIESRPSYSAVWVKYAGDWRKTRVVLGAAFATDPARFEDAIRKRWGGPVCLHEFEYTYLELRQMRRHVEKEGGLADQLGLEILWSGDNVSANRIVIGVVIYTPEQRAAIEAIYPPERLRISPALEPAVA